MWKIVGFFAAAVRDARNNSLRLYLDRTEGIQGLYYARLSGGFAFGTNVPSLLALPALSRDIDPHALHEFFTTGYVLPPHTLFKDVQKVRPGEEITFNADGLASRVVDRVEVRPAYEPADVDRFEEPLTQAARRIASDGADRTHLLSGGIDSSVIAGLFSRIDERPLNMFTASFPGSELDESVFAKIVADHFGCKSNVIDLNRDDLIEELPRLVWHLDEPTLDFSVIPTYHLFKEVRKNASVTVSGDGPDHLFGRYYQLAAMGS